MNKTSDMHRLSQSLQFIILMTTGYDKENGLTKTPSDWVN